VHSQVRVHHAILRVEKSEGIVIKDPLLRKGFLPNQMLEFGRYLAHDKIRQ
jgi:hypothetical protein